MLIRTMNGTLTHNDSCMKRNGLEALNFQYKMTYNRSTNFKYTTETIMFYTRCQHQYGLFGRNLNLEYLYIKENDERFEKIYSNNNQRIS